MKYSTVLLSSTGHLRYTAYLGSSLKRAREVADIIRNTLIRSGSTGNVEIREDDYHKAIEVTTVVNGAWHVGKVS